MRFRLSVAREPGPYRSVRSATESSDKAYASGLYQCTRIRSGSASGKRYTDSSEGIVWTVVKESDGSYTITSEDKD